MTALIVPLLKNSQEISVRISTQRMSDVSGFGEGRLDAADPQQAPTSLSVEGPRDDAVAAQEQAVLFEALGSNFQDAANLVHILVHKLGEIAHPKEDVVSRRPAQGLEHFVHREFRAVGQTG